MCRKMCSALYVHVVAGEWGSGGALSNVDTVITMCIRSRSLVCSLACNRGPNGSREVGRWMLYLSAGRLFTGW